MENNSTEQFGKLSIVATPIGNMGDFSPRAKETLLVADIIVAEDTRTLRSLLPEENIKALLIRSDNITEDKASAKVIDALAEGKHVAVITDAGTPGISDPGYLLVKRVRDAIAEDASTNENSLQHIVIEAIPGPSALAAAISISGIPATPFTFYGFPPVKKGRQTFFQTIAELDHTAVLYESPHRFMKTLEELQESFAKAATNAERKMFIGRELTKMFEEGKYGTLGEIISYYEANSDKVRGEFVIIIEGK
ncbi:MAG: 16S rRNA (cytidine(1402)-2'-O)-methyltransferase [Candidatus Pacebacteria bacterium]|nr:16S rRNA (cytidine(1402)-2'-O)-methyltransferase [Candidatus Paceibacterota bacterium]MBP9851942.1 16S rRNA (cytidine(1402)-2'-O)-methyltransferase [Candidatus Paceibacterota bacterium]